MMSARRMQVTVITHAMPTTSSPVQSGTRKASGILSTEKVVKIQEICRVCPEPRIDSAVTTSAPVKTRQSASTRRYGTPIRWTSGSWLKSPRKNPGSTKNARVMAAEIQSIQIRPVRTTWTARSGRPAPRFCPTSEEHTSELQSPCNLVCRLLLEKKKNKKTTRFHCRHLVSSLAACHLNVKWFDA